jgi:Large polyvalent protein-associated domain 11
MKIRVIGAHANRNFFDIEVEAKDCLSAFGAAALVLKEAGEELEAEFFAAIPSGTAYEMPGESVVTLGTVIEQPEVFGLPVVVQSDVDQGDELVDMPRQPPVEVAEPHRFNYMLLSRLQMDCEYYLGHGNRVAKHLWADNEAEQIAKMKELYAALPEKPEWITLEKIEEYETAMTAQQQ